MKRAAFGLSCALVLVGIATPSAALATPTGPAPGNSGQSTFVDAGTSFYGDAAVNVANGNLLVTAQDGAQAHGASALPLIRYYNSQSTSTAHEFSPGWSLSAGPDVYLTIGGHSVVAHTPSGGTATFTANSDGSFTSQTTTDSLTLANGVYTLGDENGYQDTFDSTGTLTSVQTSDETNATAVYDYPSYGTRQSVLDNLDNAQINGSLSMAYNASNTLVFFDDGDGYESDYGYDSSGRLASFTTYSGAKSSYAYNAAGKLATIVEPDGTSEAITYTGAQVSRLQVTPPGGGTPYGYAFSYQAPASSCATGSVGQTVVTPIDPSDGSATTYCYGSDGTTTLPTGATDQSGTQSGVSYSNGATPPAPPPAPGDATSSSGVSPAATTRYVYKVFNIPKHEWGYASPYSSTKLNIYGGIRTQSNPNFFAYRFDLGGALARITEGEVTPTATAWDLTKGTKVTGYSAFGKPELPGYVFHSTLGPPNASVGNGDVYQIAINIIDQPCNLPEPAGYACTYDAYLRFDFKVVK